MAGIREAASVVLSEFLEGEMPEMVMQINWKDWRHFLFEQAGSSLSYHWIRGRSCGEYGRHLIKAKFLFDERYLPVPPGMCLGYYSRVNSGQLSTVTRGPLVVFHFHTEHWLSENFCLSCLWR